MPGMTEHNVNIPMEDKQVEQAVGIRDIREDREQVKVNASDHSPTTQEKQLRKVRWHSDHHPH
jgi:hypothetical protein